MSWFAQLPLGLRIILVLLAATVLVYATYQFALNRAVPELSVAKARIKTQKAEILSLTSRLDTNRRRREVAEQEASVMRKANQLLRETESNRQAELNRLQTELDFYRRLAGTSGTQSGLAIYHLELSPTASDRVFHFILTLTQNLRRSAIVSGKVRIDVEGTLEDQFFSLPWSQVTDGNQPEPAFRFKYFQQLEGYLELPERFEPARLLLSLEVNGQKKPVARTFDWQQLTASPESSAQVSSPNLELENELSQSVPD